MASPTVRMVSAASSGISQPNSSSKAMTSSTVSRLSAPRSSIKLASGVTFSGSTFASDYVAFTGVETEEKVMVEGVIAAMIESTAERVRSGDDEPADPDPGRPEHVTVESR